MAKAFSIGAGPLRRWLRLMGGRVLPDGDRQAALLMYDDDHGTRLTLYLRLGTVEGTDLRYAESGGVQNVFSSETGLTYAVTARTSRARLLAVAQDIERQLTSDTPAPT